MLFLTCVMAINENQSLHHYGIYDVVVFALYFLSSLFGDIKWNEKQHRDKKAAVY